MKAVVVSCPCAISLDHFEIRLFMFGSYTQNQNELSVSFILRQKLIVLILSKLFNFVAQANYLDHWISDCLCFADKVKIKMNSLSV